MEVWKGVVKEIEKKHSKAGNDYWIYRVLVDGKKREFSSFKNLGLKENEPFEVSLLKDEKSGFMRVVEVPKSELKPAQTEQIQPSSDSDLVEVKRFFKILGYCFVEETTIRHALMTPNSLLSGEDIADIASTIYINAKQRERFGK